MSEATGWDELTRFEQRALIKLFGGGSFRNDDPAIARELRKRGSSMSTTRSRCLDCSF
jgi:hypothetical protein